MYVGDVLYSAGDHVIRLFKASPALFNMPPLVFNVSPTMFKTLSLLFKVFSVLFKVFLITYDMLVGAKGDILSLVSLSADTTE